jgi:hypothetical protein
MDIPNWPLNSTDMITYESERVNTQAVNSQPVMQEASKQIESPRGSQSVRRQTRRPRIQDPSSFSGAGKGLGQCQKELPTFCELVM